MSSCNYHQPAAKFVALVLLLASATNAFSPKPTCRQYSGYYTKEDTTWVNPASAKVLDAGFTGYYNGEAAKNACDLDPKCIAWNDFGKYVLGRPNSYKEESATCTYVKEADCKPVEGYNLMKDMNWAKPAGATEGYLGAGSKAMDKCNANPKCTAWNNGGYYIEAHIEKFFEYGGLCIYNKIVKNHECPSVDGYITKKDTNWIKSEKATEGQLADGPAALAKCNADKKCTAWNDYGYHIAGHIDQFYEYSGLCTYEKIVKNHECPSVDGYITKKDTNWVRPPFSNEGHLADGPAALAKCNADSKCTAWNDYGYYIEAHIESFSEYSGLCTYVKETVCPPVEGYNTKKDTNWAGSEKSTGGHLGNADKAMAKCNSLKNCTAFNDYGYYITGHIDSFFEYGGLCTYEKIVKNHECPSVEGYTTMKDTNWAKSESATEGHLADGPAALAKCNADKKCTAWNDYGYHIAGHIDSFSEYSGLCTYAKIVKNYECPSVDGYITRSNTNWNKPAGATEGHLGGGTAALARCNADPKCTAWNNYGYYIEARIENFHEYGGLCTYIKETVCPSFEGYNTKKDTNWERPAGVPEGQLDDGSAARAKCNADKKCTAWNNYGYYILGHVERFFEYGGLCTYEKIVKNHECPSVEGYITMKDTNWAGSEKATGGHLADGPAALAKCNADKKCTAWNDYGYYIAGHIDSFSEYSGLCTYFKIVKNHDCPSIAGYNTRKDTNWIKPLFADEGHLGDGAAALAKCNADSKCIAWNDYGYYLNSYIGSASWSEYSGLCTYVKETVCPNYDGYETLKDRDWFKPKKAKFTEGQLYSGAEAMAKCTADPNCSAWNSIGFYLEGYIEEFWEYTGVCTYQKGWN